MWLLPLQEHPGLALHVIERMRDWDRREIFATRAADSEITLLTSVLDTGDVSWVAGNGLEPIAAFGCAPLWSGVWSMWFFATNELSEIGLSVTKFVIRSIIPRLFEGGAHRLECRSMDGHEDAHRWLVTLGAHREGTLRGYGRNREDFHVYAWLAGGGE